MVRSDIRRGGVYFAKVSGKVVRVRVDLIRENPGNSRQRSSITYYVTNLVTNRRTMFKSASKFRAEAPSGEGK